MKLKIILILGFLFINNNLFSQDQHREKIYITSDSLSFIHLLPDDQFGYISYNGESALSYYNDKNQPKGHIDGPYFIINEFGAGKYSIDNNKIKLSFIKPKHPIDSISIHKTKNITDSININITFKSYISLKENDNIGYGNIIKSNDNLINLNTMFDNKISFKASKKRLPISLKINDNYILKIDDNKDQDIILFINEFKKFHTNQTISKIFNFNNLTEFRN